MDTFQRDICLFKNEYILGSNNGTIIHGSFVNGNKPRVFLTISHADNCYFIQTYEISQEGEELDKSKKKAIKRLRQFNPSLFNLWTERMRKKEKISHSDNTTSIKVTVEGECLISSCEKSEFKELKGMNMHYIKTIKNIASGQTEVILANENTIGTIVVSKKFIITMKVQQMNDKVISVEYWSGYYFLLYDDNSIGIYKRGITGEFEETKFIKLNIRGIKISLIKVPKLEWSGKLPDILHKEIPMHILLSGNDLNGVSHLFKWNIKLNREEINIVVDPSSEITVMNYGPYDNGPILVGLNNGKIVTYDYYSFAIRVTKITDSSVKWITYEPGRVIIIGTSNTLYKFVSL